MDGFCRGKGSGLPLAISPPNRKPEGDSVKENAVTKAMFRGAARAWLAAAIMSVAAGCDKGHPATPEMGGSPRVFVGEVAGTDVRVAIVAAPHRARIYFCGGDTSYTTATKWLVADIDEEHVTVPAADGQAWHLEARITRGSVEGTVQIGDSAPRAFQADGVAQGTVAGLYETTASCGEAGTGKVGLIVAQASPSATPIGQGACIGQDSATILQVNPIRSLAPDNDGGIAITLGKSDSAVVRPATPPAE
jgi:hypothetical protein